MGKEDLKTVNIDLPEWMIDQLDKEARKLGINRKALINVLLASVLRSNTNDGNRPELAYLKSIEKTLADEWLSKEDDDAFKKL